MLTQRTDTGRAASTVMRDSRNMTESVSEINESKIDSTSKLYSIPGVFRFPLTLESSPALVQVVQQQHSVPKSIYHTKAVIIMKHT